MAISPAPLLSLLEIEAVFLAVLAVLYAAVWLRAREPGLPWLVAGFVQAAFWYQHSGELPSTGPYIDTPALRTWSALIASAVLCVTTGVVAHIGLPKGAMRWLVVACGVPGLLLMLAVLAGARVSHQQFHFGVLLAYFGAALLAFRQAAREPGDGHAVLGLALLSLTALPFVLQAFGIGSGQLKYFAGMALAIFGMVLLTVTLLRRHRALAVEVQGRRLAEAQLRDANALLEARVSERTAHLRELIAGLETFNRGVSHDLRGPLSGMSSLARMAAEAMAAGDHSLARQALPMIEQQCDLSVQMVGTMLDLARIGEAAVHAERIDLNALVQSAFDEALLGSPQHPQPLLTVDRVPPIQADPKLLRPALVNLIANALKFTRGRPSPQIHVEVSVDERAVTVCVRDNGVGFTPEVAEHMFDPFFRGHPASHEGHGLGLSIVRRAVEALGGTVWARSGGESGAALYFRLPQAAGAAPAPASTVAALAHSS